MNNGILILAEHLKGELSDITFEMLGVGRPLAGALNAPLHAAVFGKEAATLAARLDGADTVFVVEDLRLDMAPVSTVAALLEPLLGQHGIGLVLLGGTNVSMGIGSALSARTRLPFVNFCRQARVEDGALVFTSELFGGKIHCDVRLPENRGIVSIYPGAFPVCDGEKGKPPIVEKLDLPVTDAPVRFRKFIEPEAGDVDITKQSVLVGVGRGIQSRDNLALAEELAAALGGAVCASRPVIDQGWLPLSRQVGKSGMTVKPRVYFALGISGAPEHVEGMQNSQLVISINTDPRAPIFDASHYGVCGDALELLPLLTEKIKARKGRTT